jgi:hypothetical protein
MRNDLPSFVKGGHDEFHHDVQQQGASGNPVHEMNHVSMTKGFILAYFAVLELVFF